jgi:glycosyltransferase involved in cell wall biosynthesis
MNLLVFAHTPPPHHGQSYMVKLMLDGLGGDWRTRNADSPSAFSSGIHCFHVNARFSEDLEDVGAFRFEKVLLVLRYCGEAIWCRFQHGIHAFYYVPAPGKRAALYRDWIVMLLCRPFFRHFIHHWHAVGLGDWLRREGSFVERWITHRLLGHPSLGIVLAIPSMRDALWFRSRNVEIVPNGIPDPCPDFENTVAPERRARLAARQKLLAGKTLSPKEIQKAGGSPHLFRLLYLAHCTADKGLFDTLDAVVFANSRNRALKCPISYHLTVAGEFVNDTEEQEFHRRLENPEVRSVITYAGFADGEAKAALLRESDALCFPTYYHAESFGLVILEAMGAGLPIVTTRWRAIPELLPADYPHFVPPQAPQEIARVFSDVVTDGPFEQLRSRFLEFYTAHRHVEFLRTALENLSKTSGGEPPS